MLLDGEVPVRSWFLQLQCRPIGTTKGTEKMGLRGTSLFAILWISIAPAAFAQQPYGGFAERPIKALSAEQIADLRAGRGMGLALAAELNGFPGPVHALELAVPLGLSEPQITTIRRAFEAMKAEAVPVGEKLIAQEAELDRMFATRTITSDLLPAQVEAIGQTQAALRAIHLKYHLAIEPLLTPQQAERYAELRGYGQRDHQMHHH
jgi:Spy/CpxP family protein refolding chaperone